MTAKNPVHLTDSSLEKLSRHSGRICTILEFCIKAKDHVDKMWRRSIYERDVTHSSILIHDLMRIEDRYEGK